MDKCLYLAEQEYRVAFREHWILDGKPLDIVVRSGANGQAFLRFGSVTYPALVYVGEKFTEVCVEGHRFRFEHRSSKRASKIGHQSGIDGTLTSPMTGRIRRVLVVEAEEVEAGAILMIVEAMKMEFPIKAPSSGKIQKLYITEGDSVEMGVKLLDLEVVAPLE